MTPAHSSISAAMHVPLPEFTRPSGRFAPFFLTLTILLAFTVLSPLMPVDDLDPSWMDGMNVAVAQGMVFGRDIIFTFGPYAGIFTRMYHPATDLLALGGSLYLALGCALAARVVFRSADYRLILLFALTLGLANFSRDALLFTYPLMAALMAWRLIGREGPGDAGDLSGLAFVFAGLGLLPLVKGTLLILCLGMTLIVAAYAGLRGRRTQALLVLGVPLAAAPLLWVLSGQTVGDLPRFLVQMGPIVSGYTDAMLEPGKPQQPSLYVMVSLWVLFLIARSPGRAVLERGFLLLVFALFLFVSFKSGYVRHDSVHAPISATGLLIGVLLLAVVLRLRAMVFLPLAAVVVLTWSVHVLNYSADRSSALFAVLRNGQETYMNSLAGLADRLAGRLPDTYAATRAKLVRLNALPTLDGSADIYSYDQTKLLSTGASWSPRPILQSYSAYTPELARINAEHLQGERAPRHLLFKVQTIDKRLESLDDGASWPVIRAYYALEAQAGEHLHLIRRDPAAGRAALVAAFPQQQPVVEAQVGDWVELPRSAAGIYCQIQIQHTPLGRLATTLFKPSILEIELKMADDSILRRRFVAGMGAAGFVLSPLIQTTDEFADWLRGSPGPDARKPKALRITGPGNLSMYWETRYALNLRTE